MSNEDEVKRLCKDGLNLEKVPRYVDRYWEAGPEAICLGRRDLVHAAFSQYWPEVSRIEARVMTAIRKDILNRVVMDNRTDLIAHSYFLAIDVREINPRIKRSDRRTRVVNAYYIIIEAGHTWQGFSSRVRRALQDVEWQATLQGRVLLVGDLNAHSQV